MVEISQNSNWAFFPTGSAFFIYIGEPGARRENTNMESPRAFWKHSRKTHCFSREAKWFLSFLQSSSFRARVTWGNTGALAGRLGAAGFVCRLWMCGGVCVARGGGEWDCATVAKHLETLQFHLFPNRKTKCGRSLKEKGKPQGVIFFPLWRHGCRCTAIFPSFLCVSTWCQSSTTEVEESAVASEAQSERWVFSGSFLEQRVGPIRLEMSETFPVYLPSSSSGGTGCRQAFLLHWWWEGVEPGLAESKIRCKWTPYQRSNFLFLAPGPQKRHRDARVTFSVEELSHGWLHIKII